MREEDFSATCDKCKSVCCRGVRPPLTPKRILLIESYLKDNHLGIEAFVTKENYVFPSETADGYCIFFDAKAKKCVVHPVKPETCVAGPVTFDIDVSRGCLEWYLKMESVCGLSGALSRDNVRLSKHLAYAKREIRALVKGLPREELLAILRIDEPETFKMGEEELDPEVLAKLRGYIDSGK